LDTAFLRPERLDIAGPGSISFCKLQGAEAEARIAASRAAVIICGPVDIDAMPDGPVLIVTDNPRKAFVSVVAALFTPPRRQGVHSSAIVDAEAVIDPTAYIGPHAVIGRCIVGPGTEIHANVTLYDGTRVGANVTIHAGTVVGADGFGYERHADGKIEKFLHLGGVVIEDDVEIGSNTSIDRGTLADTMIRRGVKIDNQVHIAHNCDIGEDALIIAQAMLGGSVKIGQRTWIAPATVVMNGITIGADAFCGLGSIVTKSIPDGVTVMGNPARPIDEAKRLLAAQKKIISEKT
jgi:UDP-3-O-[3-hydroxymyristoyl] glucosamine N-acyltransferase